MYTRTRGLTIPRNGTELNGTDDSVVLFHGTEQNLAKRFHCDLCKVSYVFWRTSSDEIYLYQHADS